MADDPSAAASALFSFLPFPPQHKVYTQEIDTFMLPCHKTRLVTTIIRERRRGGRSDSARLELKSSISEQISHRNVLTPLTSCTT